MNNDWLVKLAQNRSKNVESVGNGEEIPYNSDISDYEVDVETPHTDQLLEKMAEADRVGRELAHEYGTSLEKQALLGELAEVAGKGLLKGISHLGVSAVGKLHNSLVDSGAMKLASVRPPSKIGKSLVKLASTRAGK